MAIITDATNSVDSKKVTAMAKPVTAADTSLTLYGLELANGVPIQLRFPTTAERNLFFTNIAAHM